MGGGLQRSVSPSRNVKFSEVVERREIPAQTVPSVQTDAQLKSETSGLVTNKDAVPEESDKLSKAIQKLKDENLKLREENVEMREGAAGIQRLARGGPKGVYRSTSAEDAPRLLGRLTQQSTSPKSQLPAVGKTGIYRQQSSDAAYPSTLLQRGPSFAATPSLQRQGLCSSATALPDTGAGQQPLRHASSQQQLMRRP